PGFGTQITSPSASWAADGFDLKSASPSMKTYDAASDSWIGVPTTNTTLIPNINGYLLYVRGDRLATGTASPVTSTTLRTKGKLYKGTLPALTAIPDTYMSVGNPYASPIDFAQLTIGNGIDNKFYAFDPFIYGYYGYGGYQVISAAYGWKPVPGGSPVYPTGIANSTIQSGEAFFVHATTVPSLLPANYNVVFSENAKISGDDLISFARPQLGEGVKDEIQSFAVTLYTGPTQSDVVADGNAAVFNDSYAAIVDRDDARKITASGENFDLKRNGALLAIEARPSLTVNDTLFYNMTKLAKKNYQLRFVANNLEQTGLTPVLIDKYLNTRATLSISGNSALNITVNGDAASSLANRFMVVFAPLNILPVTFVNIQAARKDSGILVSWNIANEKNIRNYDIERSSDGIHFSKIGNAVAKNISQYAWLDKNATIGDNYYRVSANDIDGDIKRSNIVKVKAEIVTSSFSIYPNPVKDNIIHVYFKGQKAGKYNAQLINADGKILMSKIINLSEGNSQESIKPDTHIAHGIYQLQISNGSGSVYKMQVLF
ncbi:MAG: T9SS type A sorting domain-containing protein, partial [Ferruginibacter sp.]